jgi:DNA-binding MarR family transcriptional regulator
MESCDTRVSYKRGGERADPLSCVLCSSRTLFAVTASALAQIASDLTAPEYQTLLVLADEGACVTDRVARSLRIEAGSARQVCERLERAQLVGRQDRSPADREGEVPIALTDAGWELLDEVATEELRQLDEILLRSIATTGEDG